NAEGAWAAVSETVSLDVLGFERVGDIPPGSVMLFRAGREPITRAVTPRPIRHCIFEDIYFARPDSIMEGRRVNGQRWAFGTRLADEWSAKGHSADVVVAVPDTSRPAAEAMAERLGIPCREGFIKNRYSGRTFIMPTQAARDAAHRLKLNPIREVFEGKRVVMVDDSIVRGTTMRRIVQMVRSMGPTELHVAIFSPAVRHPCFYGIDMPSQDELVAARHDDATLEPALAERFGADSVSFLSAAGLRQVAGKSICDACFTGRYPIPVSDEERRHIQFDRRGT
ncbi:MAG: amidophosphoribosyltransferase, partial [Myxococcota bacterium]